MQTVVNKLQKYIKANQAELKNLEGVLAQKTEMLQGQLTKILKTIVVI